MGEAGRWARRPVRDYGKRSLTNEFDDPTLRARLAFLGRSCAAGCGDDPPLPTRTAYHRPSPSQLAPWPREALRGTDHLLRGDSLRWSHAWHEGRGGDRRGVPGGNGAAVLDLKGPGWRRS